MKERKDKTKRKKENVTHSILFIKQYKKGMNVYFAYTYFMNERME